MEDHNIDDASSTNLIINYLPQTLTDEEFRSLFLSVGPVKNSKIVRDQVSGYSYGYGFIDYQLASDAQRAIDTLNGLQIQNKRIKVAFARMGGDKIKGANLYVRNLPKHWKEGELNKLFEPFGKIIQSRVLVELSSGVSKGVGFVLYDTRDEAENAIKCLSGKTPEGCTEPILTKFADDNNKKLQRQQMNIQYVPVPNFAGGPGPMRNNLNRFQRFNPMAVNMNFQQGQQNGYTLFVYNIGSNATDRTLWSLFAPYGTVQKVNIMVDHDKNTCKGYGFVTMTNYTEAQTAIQGLHGYYFQGKQLQVSFKAEKNAQQQQAGGMGMANNMNMNMNMAGGGAPGMN